ncbi:MAG: hypothetical protein NTY86_16985 [Deltaproteobacteria bacterium]|nr:hypothetical protein [Deltaproteobacteria bacterium]
MEGIVRSVTAHPLVAIAVCFAALLLVYFLFKSLIKLALILILVAVLIGGYFYFQYPESRPANLKDAMEKVRVGVGKAVDQGKDAYEKGKEWVDKGKTVLDKGIDKGKDAIEKGKETAGDLGKILGGEGDAGNRQKP